MSSHILHGSFILSQFSLADIKACLNAFTDHSPYKFKSLPLLPQNGCRDKSQTFSFDRVQEITVYISSCITRVSKLSGFGGTGGSCFKHNMGCSLSLLTTLVPLLRKKPLISSLFGSGPDVFTQQVDQLSAEL